MVIRTLVELNKASRGLQGKLGICRNDQSGPTRMFNFDLDRSQGYEIITITGVRERFYLRYDPNEQTMQMSPEQEALIKLVAEVAKEHPNVFQPDWIPEANSHKERRLRLSRRKEWDFEKTIDFNIQDRQIQAMYESLFQ